MQYVATITSYNADRVGFACKAMRHFDALAFKTPELAQAHINAICAAPLNGERLSGSVQIRTRSLRRQYGGKAQTERAGCMTRDRYGDLTWRPVTSGTHY